MLVMTDRTYRVFTAFALALLAAMSVHAGDWYRWRGPDLNGISKETGWQAKWPDEGPNQLWKASVGTGFSSMTVSQGRVYTMGNENEKDTVFCLDANTGKVIWKYTYACPLDPHYFEGGPGATPTVDGDRVYTVSRKGHLFCLDAAKGEVIWKKTLPVDIGAAIPDWGFAGSPLVEGDLVILNAGDVGTAFNKTTGKTAWTSGTNSSSYATPVAFTYGKDRCVAILAFATLEIVKAADGKSVWSFPWKTTYNINASDPVIDGDQIFISSGLGHGGAMVQIKDGHPKQLWETKDMKTHFASCILWQGYIYGIDDIGDKGQLKCIAADSGKLQWVNEEFGKGNVTLADGKLIGLSNKGELIVAEPTPKEFKVISRAQVLGGKCWTVPVLANGKIYCRNAKGDLVCLDVSGK